ncbi:nuclear receptor ROR-alpha A-like [Amphiura filiformis]|uniref:nuclear receptor ROR-alpha A-like n=1 Tax=Amphiura filiformis TaxID=82378 RepID=UPI003B227C12
MATNIPTQTGTAVQRNVISSSYHNAEEKNEDVGGDICKVCGDKSKAIHYGVLTCEGCKSFFSRALTNNTSYDCPTKNCIIIKDTRNRCMYCRWLKCLAVGMSKDSAKLGRRPKNFKNKMAADTQVEYQEAATPAKIKAVEAPTDCKMAYESNDLHKEEGVEAGATVTTLPSDLSNLQITPQDERAFGITNPPDGPTPMDTSIPGLQASNYLMSCPPSSSEQLLMKDELKEDPIDTTALEEAANQSFTSFEHAFVFQCSHGHPSESIMSHENIRHGHHMVVTSMEPNPGMDVNKSMFQRMTGLIEKVVKFCKGVPGFRSLSLNDQMLILKGATFEIVALQTASVVDLENEMLTFLGDPHVLVPFNMLSLTPFGIMLEELKHVGSKLKSLEIRPIELSLLCGVVLLSPGRPGLEKREVVDKQQLLLSRALRHKLRQTHPTNFDDVFTSLMLLMPHVREINCQHSNMIVKFNEGQPDVLPPLHKEVFAGDDN